MNPNGPRTGRKRRPTRLPDVLTTEELQQVLDVPNRQTVTGLRNAVLLRLLGKCALRVGEAVGLSLGDIHLNDGRPWLRVIGKGDKERRVRLGPATADLLRHWLDRRPKRRGSSALLPVIQAGRRAFGAARPGRAMSIRSAQLLVHAVGEKAGLSRPLHPHTLRHTCASLAVAAGESLAGVRDLLGHSNIATTSVYLHTSGAEQAEMMGRLDPREPASANSVSGGASDADRRTIEQFRSMAPAEKAAALRALLGQ